MVPSPLLPWMTSSVVVVSSPLLPLSSLAQQKRVASDQVQRMGYSKSEVDTFVAALELETSAAVLELEMDVAPLEFKTDTASLELDTETDMSQEISKQKRYSSD
jgi:hypothetical protein